MTATLKPFLQDPYRTEFEAEVLSCAGRDDGRFDVFLDQTYFYPESGGQLSDRGVIGGIAVVDVQEAGGDRVLHVTEAEVPSGRHACGVDWQRRFDHMQHHTGQHVLSRAFIEVAGLETVSFHMGDDACTIDLSGGGMSDDNAAAAETLANDVIFQDRVVHVRNLKPDELDSDALRRKLPAGVSEVRLVDIEDFDVCGCCGTHVRRTGELGAIKVLRYEKAKGAHRVSFKVGRRALADFAAKHDIVKTLANRFTTAPEALLEKVDKLQSENQQQRKDNKRLSQRLAEVEAAVLVEHAIDHDGVRYVFHFAAEESDDYVRALAAALKSVAGTVAVVANSAGTVVCNAAPDSSVDFAGVIEYAKASGGSGGGKGGFANVRLSAGADAKAFLDEAARLLTN